MSTTGPNGPWLDAVAPARASLPAGEAFWVRLVIENLETGSTIEKLAVAGIDSAAPRVRILEGECMFATPIDAGARGECIVGPSTETVQTGERSLGLVATGTGERQGEDENSIIQPPLPLRHEFRGLPYEVGFTFEAHGGRSQTQVLGNAGVAQVDFADATPPYPLSAGVVVNCDDKFRSGGGTFTGYTDSPPAFAPSAPQAASDDPRLLGFAITVFDVKTGAEIDRCRSVVSHTVEFDPADPIVFQYIGS